MSAAIELFSFTDYRAFLREVFQERKRTRPGWSYGSWARTLGLKSQSMLVMILRGQRHPGTNLIRSLCRQLRLSPAEAEYFTDLVHLEKSKNDVRLSVLLMERLAKRHASGTFRYLAPDVFETISNWHYYAIRELVLLKDFVDDTEWMCRALRFKVTPKQAADARETLLRLGLLEVDANGRLIQASGKVETHPDVMAEGARRFHEQMLQHAQLSVRTVPTIEREIMGSTFAISLCHVPRAKELIRKFHHELCDLIEEKSGDSLYQLHVAFFPLTQGERPTV